MKVRHADLGNCHQFSAEDVRSYKFTSFDAKEEMSPTPSQLQAAESLVDALDLTQGAALFPHAVHLFVPSDSMLQMMQPRSLMLYWVVRCKSAAVATLSLTTAGLHAR